MSKITYNAELLKIMTLFETATRVRLKDCFIDHNEQLTFVVNQVDMGKAIGKGAVNVKNLENMLKRKIKILGFNPSAEQFLRNLIYPIKPEEVQQEGSVLIIKAQDTKTKGMLIGRNRSNIANMLDIINKYFKEIQDIKVN